MAGAEIAEEVLQACQHLGRTTAGLKEREHSAFRRMHVVEPQHTRAATMGFRPSACRRQRHQDSTSQQRAGTLKEPPT